MEISSFQFLNQEEIANLCALLQEMDNEPHTSSLFDNNGGNPKKRAREGREENQYKKREMRDVLASLLLLEEEEVEEKESLERESEMERFEMESNHWQKVQTMDGHLSSLNDYYAEAAEVDRSRTKRARRTASAVAAGAETAATTAASGRRLWVKSRSKDWWEKCNSPEYPDEDFKKCFRMSKSTFDMICEELEPAVTKKNTTLREAIPVRQRVAVCIWRLASGEPLRLVSKRFGLGISTCHKLVLEVCSAIKTVLMPKYVVWPGGERMQAIKADFCSISGIPDVGGAMYTTHVPIIAPKISVAAYFNKRHTERNHKTSYSITVQGVVDSNGIFTDICIGWPGSMPDDKVLEKSALHQRGDRGLLKDEWIVGTSGHPLTDWVLVPYSHQNLTWTQHAFNAKVAELQAISKDAFMRLKARWSCLQKRTEVKLQDLPAVLGACCVLHNICEMNKEDMDSDLRIDLFDDPMLPENNLRSVTAIQRRDHIAHNILHRGLVGSSFL